VTKSSITDLDKFKADFRQSVADSLISESPDLDGLISESNVVVNNISDVSRRRIVLASGLSVDYTITTYHVQYSSLNAVANSTLSSPSFASYLKNNTGYQFTGVSALAIVNLSPTGSPTYAPSIAPTKAPVVTSATKSSNSLSAGAIAGIVIGCCVAVALLCGGIYFLYRERSRVLDRQGSYIYPTEGERERSFHGVGAVQSSLPLYQASTPMNQWRGGLSNLVGEGGEAAEAQSANIPIHYAGDEIPNPVDDTVQTLPPPLFVPTPLTTTTNQLGSVDVLNDTVARSQHGDNVTVTVAVPPSSAPADDANRGDSQC
jgi:hypothetical protein